MSATWPCPRCDFRGPHRHIPLLPEAQADVGATHWIKCGRCIVQDVWGAA